MGPIKPAGPPPMMIVSKWFIYVILSEISLAKI